MLLAVACLTWSLVASGGAAEILLVSPGAMSSSLKELIPAFEHASGHKVTVKFAPALALAARIAKGEGADVAILSETAAGKTVPAVRDVRLPK